MMFTQPDTFPQASTKGLLFRWRLWRDLGQALAWALATVVQHGPPLDTTRNSRSACFSIAQAASCVWSVCIWLVHDLAEDTISIRQTAQEKVGHRQASPTTHSTSTQHTRRQPSFGREVRSPSSPTVLFKPCGTRKGADNLVTAVFPQNWCLQNVFKGVREHPPWRCRFVRNSVSQLSRRLGDATEDAPDAGGTRSRLFGSKLLKTKLWTCYLRKSSLAQWGARSTVVLGTAIPFKTSSTVKLKLPTEDDPNDVPVVCFTSK